MAACAIDDNVRSMLSLLVGAGAVEVYVRSPYELKICLTPSPFNHLRSGLTMPLSDPSKVMVEVPGFETIQASDPKYQAVVLWAEAREESYCPVNDPQWSRML